MAAAARTSATRSEVFLMPELRPPVKNSGPYSDRVTATPMAAAAASAAQPVFRGFNGLTHLDQRFARNGNQFSTEPPDQALAVGGGFVLEAVNSALNVYDTNGVQLLVKPVALSQFFGLAAGINRTTGTFGVFPGDVGAAYDPETQRWFVVAFAQLNDSAGNPLPQSRLYLAVSQTSDPTGVYSIYILNTTDARDPDGAGARIPDFPHFAVDHYALSISFNEFQISSRGFIDGAIISLSKQALVAGTGGAPPPAVRFSLPFVSGYEFTVFPATPGADTGPDTSNGGTQYFVSSHFVMTTEHSLAVWALSNTSSIDTTPSLNLQAVAVNTQPYHFPSKPATQKKGFHPLGESLGEPVEKIDTGDFRIISVCYASGRLWATLNSEVIDSAGTKKTGADYFALVPNLQGRFLTAKVATQGSVSEAGANLIYPAIAINAKNRGAMVVTLVGPDDFPSSAFVPISLNNGAGPIQIARAGNEPDDGFSGYPEFGGDGTGRWGDYAAASVDGDGVIWMANEYIPDLARSSLANWSTYITRYQP